MADTFGIRGGSIAVEDGIKSAAEYTPPRKARVELTFDIAPGEDVDAFLAYVSKLASERVHAILHKIEPAEVAAPVAREAAVAGGAGGSEQADAQPAPVEPKRRGRKPKATDTGEAPAPVAEGGEASAPDAPPSAEDPFGEAPNPPQSEATAAPAQPESDKVTDAALHHAVQDAIPRLGAPRIKELIETFKPAGYQGPFSLSRLAAAERRTFLERLAAL